MTSTIEPIEAIDDLDLRPVVSARLACFATLSSSTLEAESSSPKPRPKSIYHTSAMDILLGFPCMVRLSSWIRHVDAWCRETLPDRETLACHTPHRGSYKAQGSVWRPESSSAAFAHATHRQWLFPFPSRVVGKPHLVRHPPLSQSFQLSKFERA